MSLCCVIIATITLIAGKFYLPFFLVAGTFLFLALVIFSLTGQIAWVVENMYFNVFIYKMFNASAEDISLMVSASAISATVTTILIGALSDKIGKRKLYFDRDA
mgnify:CR=1 FL=1